MIKGCIFDLDGVIVDTARYHYLAWRRLAKELGYNLTEVENERLKGVSRMESLERILSLAGLSLDQSRKETLAKRKNDWFQEYLQSMSADEIYPGVRVLIEELKTAGTKVGLASSSKNARTVVSRLQIENDFDAIVDGGMIRHTKPHPEIFLTAARLLAVDPPSCVVIEDAEAGVEAAHAAGMKCIAIGSSDRLGKADRVFAKTSQVKVSTVRDIGMTKK